MARKVAKKEQTPSTKESKHKFVPLDEAFSRVIGELTEMRVRQRALLDVMNSGEFSWDAYVRKVREIRRRDFDALFGALVLTRDAFLEEFHEWIHGDAERYLYKSGIVEEGTDSSQPVPKRAVKVRKGKK